MKPILFNTEMVQAILDGRKTVTRRVIKPQPNNIEMLNGVFSNGLLKIFYDFDEGINIKAPYEVGDILYVRETFKRNMDGYSGIDFGGYSYKADCKKVFKDSYNPWRPSIHMPKEAARIFLKVTDVRVERLQDITEEQAEKEGVKAYGQNNCSGTSARIAFAELWDSISETEFEWRANPWVWVIDFERVEVDNEN